MSPPPRRVLFLCVANSARSPMAEALAKRLLGPDAVVASAGARPASAVHPLAVAVMREEGIDIASHVPRSAESVDPDSFDLVISLCAEEVRPPSLLALPHLSWPVHDPASFSMELSRGMALDGFRSALDAIEARLRRFAAP